MVTRWLHVTETGGNLWVLPIWSSINHAVSRGTCAEPNGYTRELGIHISTRLNMLPMIVKRINAGWKALYQETMNYGDECIFEPGKEGYATPVKAETINSLLIDIDSFLFETNSCCELMTTFLGEIYKLRGEEIKKEDIVKKLRKILIENGQNPNWFIFFDKDRNFFIHEGAPYVAIDISDDTPDLLIMKENLKSFNDPKKYSRLSELDAVVKGFSEAIGALRNHMIYLCSH
jgi:hypothetical protein